MKFNGETYAVSNANIVSTELVCCFNDPTSYLSIPLALARFTAICSIDEPVYRTRKLIEPRRTRTTPR